MGNKLVESKSRFSFILDGENEVDVTILAKTMADITELARMAAVEESPEAYTRMTVSGFKHGSFQIDFAAVCSVARSFFVDAAAATAFAATVIGAVKGVFEVKRLLGGKKPKSIEPTDGGNITITGEDGKSIVVPKASAIVVNNIYADQRASDIGKYAREHAPEGGFTISTEHGEAAYKAADIERITKSLPFDTMTLARRWVTDDVKLVIKKADVMGGSRWDFYYNSKIISAAIDDVDWLKRLHSRAFTIGYNDTLTADLETYVDIDVAGIPVDGSERYTVLRIKGDITSPPEQLSIFSEQSD